MAIESKTKTVSAVVGFGLVAALASLGCSSLGDTSGTPAPGTNDTTTDGGHGAADGGSPKGDAAAPGSDGAIVDPPGQGDDDAGSGTDGAPPPEPAVRVVGYVPNYNGSYSDWAQKIDFNKMTHLNLAFASATGSNDWDMGAADDEVKAIVDAAHAAGTKVLASLGGGGGDQSVIARYKDTNNIDPLIANLDAFIAKHDLDGADVDIEDGNNLGQNYSTFITKMVATLRPKGKLVTAAVAQYLQDSMSDTTLHDFDFVNVMVYSTYQDGVDAMTFYTGQKNMDPKKLTLGAGFFGSDNGGTEYAYADIMNADNNAWSKDQATVNGQTVHYTGMATMKKITDYSKGFGGIMFWEITEDTFDSHSLYKVIQGEM